MDVILFYVIDTKLFSGFKKISCALEMDAAGTF